MIGPRGGIESLERITRTGQKHSWKNPHFKGRDIWQGELTKLAFDPDGTVWLPLANELFHLGYDGEAIQEIERFPLPESHGMRCHCDANGDVWIVSFHDQDADKRPRLYRFATHSKSPGN